MTKLTYILLIIYCAFTNVALGTDLLEGSKIWDPSQVARVALALKDNPTVQTEFLEMAAGDHQYSKLRTKDIDESEDFISYALTPVRVGEQLTLTPNDILTKTENAGNLENIFYINLNDLDFTSPEAGQVIKYLNENRLHNLRVIDLRGSSAVSNLIEQLFGSNQSKDKFVSLFRITCDQTDITSHDLDKIFNYFSNCTFFVRDMRQISSRYNVTAAFFSVEVRNVKGQLASVTDWRKGKKTTKSDFTILYRSKEQSVNGPFIMSIET